MASDKENVGVLDQKRQDGGYVQADGPSQATPQPVSSPVTRSTTSLHALEQTPTYEEATRSTGAVPTVDCPFNFPAATELPPSYEAHTESDAASTSSSPKVKPIAIPQIAPDSAAPFVVAYPPSLLAYGITEQAWQSFLDTVSAFLTAKVSDRAIAHAGDMAKSLGGPPRNYAKNLVNHTKSVGKQIAKDAKRFNVFGVTASFIGGAISIPMHLAFGAVHTIVEIPGTALSAIVRTPRTPLQRAATYSAVANKDWLNARGLHAVLLDTKQLAEMVHMPTRQLLDIAAVGGKDGNAAAALAALDGHIEKLKIVDDDVLVLSEESLWFVLVPVVKDDENTKQ